MTTKESSKSKWFTVFSLLKIKKKGQKMKNIDKKILMAEEEIKQLQNKRKKLISQQKQEERKKEIDGFMKKEESLKVSLPKARILPKTNFIS